MKNNSVKKYIQYVYEIEKDGADLFRVRTPKKLHTPVFALNKVEELSVRACNNVKDDHLESVAATTL